MADKENELSEIHALYASGLPSIKELLIIDEELDVLTPKKAELGYSIFTEEKQEKLFQLSNHFNKGVPNIDRLLEIANKIGKADKIEACISQEQINSKNSMTEDLSDKFRKGISEEKSISPIQQTVKLYAENEDKIKHLITDSSIIPNKQYTPIKNRNILNIIFSVLVDILIIAGGIFVHLFGLWV